MTGVSTLGQALAQIERFKDQQLLLDTLGTQLATGKKTNIFSGLQQNVLTSQRARADVKSLDNYINNIDNADRRIQLMLNSIEEFKAQAENFAGLLTGFSQQSKHQEGEIVYYDDPSTPDVVEQIPVGMDSSDPTVELKTLTDYATKISDLFVDLLNQKDGDRYLLTGAETLTKPIATTSTLDAAVNTLIAGWKAGTITTSELVADLQDRTTSGGNANALTDTIVGYSSVLSAGNAKDIFVRTDETTEINYTALANDDPFRDIMVAVSYIKTQGMSPVVDEVDPATLTVITEGAPGATTDEMKDNYFAVFNELAAMVNKAIDDIDQVRYGLELDRARLAETKTAHKNERKLLLDIVSNVEDVDINEVAVSINSLSVQLDASYRVTARSQQISLVNFL